MIQSEALNGNGGVRHGFFTRRGGVSGGVFASLNCGFGSGDEASKVDANRQAALLRLGLDGGDLLTVRQVHSSDAVAVEAPWTRQDTPRADGMATRRPGLALGVLTADCGPVLLADAEAGVIGAAHAGWRGARDGVLEATVAVMEDMGAKRERISAAVGPCIAQQSYEIGPELFEDFTVLDASNGELFVPSDRDGHYLFDLAGYIERRLKTAGIGDVDVLGVDTYSDEDRFYSYRRTCHQNGADYGRGLSAIALLE